MRHIFMANIVFLSEPQKAGLSGRDGCRLVTRQALLKEAGFAEAFLHPHEGVEVLGWPPRPDGSPRAPVLRPHPETLSARCGLPPCLPRLCPAHAGDGLLGVPWASQRDDMAIS